MWSQIVWTSVRARLVLLVLLAILPALGLAFYTGLQHRRMAAAKAQQAALRLVRIAAADYEQLIQQAHQLLLVLSRLPSVTGHDAQACSAFLGNLLKKYSEYANLGVVDTASDIVCSGQPLSGPTNLADRTYIRRTIETLDFAVGDYEIGRMTGKATINFGYPLLDRAGDLQAVVFAMLDLAWLNRLVVEVRLPPGSTLTAIDRTGSIVVRHPDPETWVGRPAPELPVTKFMLAGGEGTIEASGMDGVARLYGFTSLRSAAGGPVLYVRVGIPTSTAYAEADRLLARNLMTLGLVGALALAAAWMYGNRFILRGVLALASGTERLKAGDLTARVEVTGRDELSILAAKFNEMADRLQAASDQVAAHVRELEHRTHELNLLWGIDRMILVGTPLQDLLTKAVETFARLAGSQTCVLVTADPESGELTAVANWGPDPEAIRKFVATMRLRVGDDRGCFGKVMATREPVLSQDVASDPSMERHRDDLLTLGIRAVLAVPLVTDHQVLGAVGIGYSTPRSVSEAEIQTMTRFANHCAVAWEQARLLEEAKERRRLEEALYASRQLFESVVQSSSDAIVVADSRGRILRCNAAAGTLFGYTEEELMGMPVITLMPERYREVHRQGLERFRTPGKARATESTVEVEALRKDGSKVPIELSTAGWKAGGELFYSAILRDITERKQYATRLERTVQERTLELTSANEQLAAASRHKSEFLNNMSHEMRTPLTSIIGFAELLRDAGLGPLTEKQARFAQNIQIGGKHLLSLINDLLDLSRVEAGKIEFRPEPFGLQEALQVAVMEIRPQADQKQLDVQLCLDEAPITIVADPVRFKQILLNLLSNAVKYTLEGGRIVITALRDPHMGGFITLAVADTGIGIHPEHLPKLFREFVRLDAATTRRIPGTGIGLALTKKLVELHGWQITAASDGEGRGSTFTVRLPLTPTPRRG
jgi:PAS domain S-box-containing protein